MKIQLSPTRLVKDAVTVWFEPGPEVDIAMDVKNLTFAENSLDAIYSFHVLDHLYPREVKDTMQNWYSRLKPRTGFLFVFTNDFEFITRSFVGGDVNIEAINEKFATPMHFTSESLTAFFHNAGFNLEATTIWFNLAEKREFNFPKEPYELVISSVK